MQLLEMDITIPKMKHMLYEIIGIWDPAEERINKLEHVAVDIIQNQTQG